MASKGGQLRGAPLQVKVTGALVQGFGFGVYGSGVEGVKFSHLGHLAFGA